MIWLIVEDYCQNCPKFEPEVEKTTLHAYDEECGHNTTIRCENRWLCMDIAERIKEYIKKGND